MVAPGNGISRGHCIPSRSVENAGRERGAREGGAGGLRPVPVQADAEVPVVERRGVPVGVESESRGGEVLLAARPDGVEPLSSEVSE